MSFDAAGIGFGESVFWIDTKEDYSSQWQISDMCDEYCSSTELLGRPLTSRSGSRMGSPVITSVVGCELARDLSVLLGKAAIPALRDGEPCRAKSRVVDLTQVRILAMMEVLKGYFEQEKCV